MIMNKEQVLNYLPHKPPFLFVDEVETIEVPENVDPSGDLTPKDLIGCKVVAHFEVKEDLEILKGHFPGNPILPGVIQVEMMAQASAFASLVLNNLDPNGVKVDTLLLGVDSARFRKPIVPGMSLRIETKMVKCRGNFATYECEITSNGEKTSSASFLAQLTLKREE